MSLFHLALRTVRVRRMPHFHDELGSGDEALCGCVSEYLHRYLAANAMGFTDPGHLELHGFL